MNTLGHPYVAFKVTGRMNPYLVAGSHLPDLVPFVPDSVFTFEEIHESPEKFLKFLDKKYPYARDLALGMMSHSVKFGADKFNRDIEEWLLAGNEELKDKLILKIAGSSGVNSKIGNSWLHNYLWSGVDLYLLYKEPEFVKNLAKVHREIDEKEITSLLTECFGKDEKEVKRMVNHLLIPLKSVPIISLEVLVKIWKKALAGLPEKNRVDEEKTARLFNEIYQQFENQWENILEKVVKDVKQRMEPFL